MDKFFKKLVEEGEAGEVNREAGQMAISIKIPNKKNLNNFNK